MGGTYLYPQHIMLPPPGSAPPCKEGKYNVRLVARGLDFDKNQPIIHHHEGACSKALLKENYDLRLKDKEFENKNSNLLDDLSIRTKS